MTVSVSVGVCASVWVGGWLVVNFDFKDKWGADKHSSSISAVQEVCVLFCFLSSIGADLLPRLFFFSLFQKSAVQYANVLFFKKCYCTVNIIVNIFVSSR